MSEQQGALRQMADRRGMLPSPLVLWLMLSAISFTMGLQSWLGLPILVSKAAVMLLAILFFISAQRSWCFDRRIVLAFGAILGIVLTGVVGNLVQGRGTMFPLLFIEDIVSVSFLLFAGTVVVTAGRRPPVVALFWILVAAQAVALTSKAIVYGVDESHWIGTMHQSAGQLSTVVPVALIGAAIALGMVWSPAYLGLTILAIAMAVIGEKRAGLYLNSTALVGFCILTAFLIRYASVGETWWARAGPAARSVFVAVLLALSVASPSVFVKLIPSFQPSEVRSFTSDLEAYDPPADASILVRALYDADRVIAYTIAYLTRSYDDKLNTSTLSLEENKNIQLGRALMIVEMARTFATLPPVQQTFGLGGSAISASPHLGADRDDIMFDLFGLRGAVPLAFKVLFEAGLVGFGLLALLFAGIGIRLIRQIGRARTKHQLSLYCTTLYVHAAVTFDSFLYSDVAWTSLTVSPLYFTLLGASIMPWTDTSATRDDGCSFAQ